MVAGFPSSQGSVLLSCAHVAEPRSGIADGSESQVGALTSVPGAVGVAPGALTEVPEPSFIAHLWRNPGAAATLAPM